MKKVLFALAMLPLLAFVSCSSDDDETPDVSEKDFDHNIELLYGKWRATGVELGELVIDLTDTNEEGEEIFAPTYVSFAENGSFSSSGLIGETAGEYTTKGKTITVATGENKEDKLSFEMTSLTEEVAKIIIDPTSLDLQIETDGIKEVTVVLTKQKEVK